MIRVAIFTTFSSYSEAYSLNRVVMNQIRMLLDHGYKPVVIVGKNFIPVYDYADPNVELRTIPDVPVSNEVQTDATFDQDVGALERELSTALKDVQVVLTHDLVYQPACVKHLIAAKRIAKRRPDLRWLHWIHSATSPYVLQNLRPFFVDEYVKIIQEKFPNSFYIYFNHYSIPRIAQNFNVDDEDVKIVHHPTDLKAFYKIDENAWQLIKQKKIHQADIVCTYPIRLDRGKQVEKVIKLIASFKQLGASVRLVVCDFHSTGGDKVTYRDELKQIAVDWGLDGDDITFTSEYIPEWNVEVPYTSVADFMHISNLFVMPSVSESYSLITQEAGISGVAMVVNFDFPPFRDIFGWEPYEAKFSSNLDMMTGLDGNTTTTPKDEKEWYRSLAKCLSYEFAHNRVLSLKTRLRRDRNLDSIFEKELEPLLNFVPPVK
jgi:glycosyltransferase involved in cell wall biosynthesis